MALTATALQRPTEILLQPIASPRPIQIEGPLQEPSQTIIQIIVRLRAAVVSIAPPVDSEVEAWVADTAQPVEVAVEAHVAVTDNLIHLHSLPQPWRGVFCYTCVNHLKKRL